MVFAFKSYGQILGEPFQQELQTVGGSGLCPESKPVKTTAVGKTITADSPDGRPDRQALHCSAVIEGSVVEGGDRGWQPDCLYGIAAEGLVQGFHALQGAGESFSGFNVSAFGGGRPTVIELAGSPRQRGRKTVRANLSDRTVSDVFRQKKAGVFSVDSDNPDALFDRLPQDVVFIAFIYSVHNVYYMHYQAL